MIAHITFVYFALGFISALIVVELTDGKASEKSNLSDIEHEIHLIVRGKINET